MDVMDLLSLKGRVAIVTGGGRGLGLQMAYGLAEAGAAVVISGRRPEFLAQAEQELRAAGHRVTAVPADATDAAGVRSLVEATLQEYGQIDILVNNAGITWGAPAESMAEADFARVLQTNVTGTFLCSQAVATAAMIPRRSGKIINISSVTGIKATPLLQTAGYTASKAAVIGLTRQLAAEWGQYNICVNAIAPGFFPTRMTKFHFEHFKDQIAAASPLRRHGGPDDLKGACVLLASAASDFITGQVILVDGGETVT